MRAAPAIEVLLTADERYASFCADARDGLGSRPRSLPPKWLYDAEGSRLFDEITRLPEYYLTRCERRILTANAADIASATRADTLIELGSGTSEKTRLLLDAFVRTETLRRFVAFDVSEQTLVDSAAQLALAYPQLQIAGIVGDFERHLGALPDDGRRLVAFLGSSIGNLDPDGRALFLGALRELLTPTDGLLLGLDLVKDPRRLQAAYNDRAGVTATFIRNLLVIANRELDGDFDVDAFAHFARWCADDEWMELGLRATRPQQVRLRELDLELEFAQDEELRSEISAKFRRDRFERELGDAGFSLARWWTDAAYDFAVCLAVPR